MVSFCSSRLVQLLATMTIAPRWFFVAPRCVVVVAEEIAPFPLGSPCYANYQCEKNVAFCRWKEEEGIVRDSSDAGGGGDYDDDAYAHRSSKYKYRVEAEYGLHGYDEESFREDLAMNVARFASSVAKLMDVDARTVEALEVIGPGESQSRIAKNAVKVVFIKFGLLSKTLVEAAEKGNRLTTITAEEVVAALRQAGLENVVEASASSGDGFIQVYGVGASDESEGTDGEGDADNDEFAPPPSPLLLPPSMPSPFLPPFSPLLTPPIRVPPPPPMPPDLPPLHLPPPPLYSMPPPEVPSLDYQPLEPTASPSHPPLSPPQSPPSSPSTPNSPSTPPSPSPQAPPAPSAPSSPLSPASPSSPSSPLSPALPSAPSSPSSPSTPPSPLRRRVLLSSDVIETYQFEMGVCKPIPPIRTSTLPPPPPPLKKIASTKTIGISVGVSMTILVVLRASFIHYQRQKSERGGTDALACEEISATSSLSSRRVLFSLRALSCNDKKEIRNNTSFFFAPPSGGQQKRKNRKISV